MRLQVGIDRWEAWAPGIRGTESWQSFLDGQLALNLDNNPDYLWLKPRQRRRLSMISKMTLDVAGSCCDDNEPVSTVFASRRGEVSRMAKILMAIQATEEASPTDFSLSVHNTSSGLLSINTGNQMPSTAIAAGCDSLLAGFTEAYAQLACGRQQVMLVVFEDQLPDVYQCFASGADHPVAMAFMLSARAEQQLELKVSNVSRLCGEPESTFSQLLAVINTLLTGQPSTFTGEHHLCHLQLN